MAKAPVLEIVETQDPGTKLPHVRYDANLGGKNVGFVVVASPSKGAPPGEMGLRAFYVSPQYRGTGLATKLMIHALTQNVGRRIALRPRPYEEAGGKKPPKSLKQLKEMYEHYGFRQSPTRPELMTQKAAQESAAGIPDRSSFGDTSELPVDELLNYVTQEHDAHRAGKHLDLRFGKDDLQSWAVPKGMPEPGERRLAIQQPLHAGQSAGFEGEIPAGEYGAGTVKIRERGTVLVTKAEPGIVNFVVTHKKYPEQFSLVRTKDRKWLLLNTTPVTSEAQKAHKKKHYTIVDPKDVEKVLDGSYAISAKIDGASALFSVMKDKIEAISYRTDTLGRPITHTHRIPGLSPAKPPKELHGAVLGGEIYAERGGKTLAPQEIGGLLNASTETSRRKQIGEKIKMKAAIFRVLRDKGKLVDESAPYAQQMARLQEIVKSLPRGVFNLPPTETDPQRARELYEKIRSGKFPLTSEGIVATPLAGGKPKKVKFRQEQDVWIKNIFPAAVSSGPPRAGGFDYSFTPEGDVVGRVGTGYSHETLQDMLASPEKYVGRMARVSSQGRFPKTQALRAPSFISLHEDYPAPGGEKTAAAKFNYTKVHGHAKERTGSVGWYFHNFATHAPNVGYQHCTGGPANPYKLRHRRVDGKLRHDISKAYARGHGMAHAPQWFKFPNKHGKGWWSLDDAVQIDVADVPEKYKMEKVAAAKNKKKIFPWTAAEKAVFKTKHGKDPLLATYGVSFFKDPNGYFCATHRCRSQSKSAPDKVTATEITRIEKTGAAPTPKTIKLPTILEKLKEIKALSDKRQYQAKHSKLQALLLKSPAKFVIDSEGLGIVGLTHVPTGFRFHVPREVIAGLSLEKTAATNFLVKMAVISSERRLPLLVEVAVGPGAERRGLGGRMYVPGNFGMLFKSARSFWMKNCRFDLDLAFMDKAGAILEIQHMRAEQAGQPLPLYTAKSAGVISAVELPGGWCNRHAVVPGDCLKVD